jgi:hypothetical protein
MHLKKLFQKKRFSYLHRGPCVNRKKILIPYCETNFFTPKYCMTLKWMTCALEVIESHHLFKTFSQTFAFFSTNLHIPVVIPKSAHPNRYLVCTFFVFSSLKGIVSRDWKGLQMVSFDRFEV